MKIEKEAIKLSPINMEQIKLLGNILGLQREQKLMLNPERLEILESMKAGQSLSQIVRGFVEKGKLPSFESLAEMVEFLVRERIILNSDFHAYFEELDPAPSGEKLSLFDELSQKLFGAKPDEKFDLQEVSMRVPFLRSIDPSVRAVFLENSRLIEAPAGVVICQTGQKQRSLFALIKGQASVFKKRPDGSLRKIATLGENAVFGETGFFLGEPRTADVVTDTPSRILKIKYVNEIYGDLIQTERARQLQKRFWLVHALLHSSTFREIPEDCFDALIFAGELKTFPAQTLICRQGDFGDTCYIVVQGTLVVSQTGNSIRVLQQGDVFGEIALIMTGGKRSASVQSQSEVLLLEINSKKFYDLLAHNLLLARELERVALARIKNAR